MKVTRRVDVETVETPSPPGATLDPAELRDVEGLVGSALDAMLAITRSPLGFIALVDQGGELRLTERSAGDAGGLNGDSIRTIARSVMDGEPARSETSTFMGVPIELAGSVIGMLGVANASAYTPAERQALRIFADHIATAVELARLRHSRRALVETLVNARAELERSEEKRAVAEERARSAERLENAHRLAVQALTEVSANLRVSEGLPEFYRRLTASVAGLVGARRCLFWQVNREGMLEAIPGAYGVDDDFVSRLYPAPCDPEGTDLTSQVVYKDLIFRAATADKKQSERDRAVLSTLQVRNAISVPWRAGEHRLGVIAVYDSERADAFSREDAWVLQIVGLAAGLVWQLMHSEAELKETVERLRRVDSARQLLLRNLSTAIDRAQRRWAGELHDDALQRLTAAELRLERAAGADHDPSAIDDVRNLLGEVEEALRKLLFNVRPPALDSPGGLEQTIRDRIGLLRANSGVAVQLKYSLADDPPFEIKSTIYRQLAESFANIEKHAGAKVVRVTVQPDSGGVYGCVIDDGRGFIVAERNHLPGHLGLLALNERALLAGGWCKISSEPGAGTIIEFWVPLPS
ncbi:MAG TPA: GAF domain-containing protein [Candidatus Dormibacteraeota bacterium]|nr:GAF domain-containing protein [Candidatus Dormibacteraeota bacterium]